jgi:hypothetical protein
MREAIVHFRSNAVENRWARHVTNGGGGGSAAMRGGSGGNSGNGDEQLGTLVPSIVQVIDILDQHVWDEYSDLEQVYTSIFNSQPTTSAQSPPNSSTSNETITDDERVCNVT